MIRLAVILATLGLSVSSFAQEISEQRIGSDQVVGATNTSSVNISVQDTYSSNIQMREERKVGISTQIGGGLGMFGVNLEVNVDGENTAVAGMGTGTGYGTFQMLWKHHWEGKYFTPYTSAGLSRWYNSDSSDSYKKSLILDRALSDEQKESGRFGVDFLTASGGMEYQQLSGDFAGTSFFAEFGVLSALRNPTPLLIGSIGAAYYF
jgi:hypothetical protein